MAAEKDPPGTRLDPSVLLEVAEGTAGETGEAFFQELVRHLSQALGTKGAWVTEWLPEERRLAALAFWYDGAPFGDYEYAIGGTPCETVIEAEGLVHFPERVVELFPDDPDLPAMDAVAYMGVPLFDVGGEILGHLAVLHDAPMPPAEDMEAVFRIFAGRAAAELRRLRRDRFLRDRERRLSGLLEGAMDAILELDAELIVRGANSAAERTFARPLQTLLGMPPERLLGARSGGELRALAAGLDAGGQGEQAVWIAGEFEVRTDEGTPFPAEATLSIFELDGATRYTLILRDVDERRRDRERIRRLSDETRYLREELEEVAGGGILGESPAMRAVLADVERVARSDTSVLITGETGTGKELVARAVHARSGRAGRPMIRVNCAAIAAHLQESEFFGHVKGAFTGAHADRAGRFALADGGTIFLDEVGEMPLDLQAKLLRVLQEGEFEPVGSSRTQRVDVRVVAATNRDLEERVRAGEFREDLLYRLNVFPLRVPPLRDRGEDVCLLAEAFLRRIAQRQRRPCPGIDAAGRERLLAYRWPGNVRELENVLERAMLVTPAGEPLDLGRALAADPRAAGAGAAAAATRAQPGGEADGILTEAELRERERANLRRALEATGWKVSGAGGAAELLGMNANTLASRMRTMHLERPRGGSADS